MFSKKSNLKKLKRRPSFLQRVWRLIKLGLLLLLLAVIALIAIDRYVSWTTQGSIYHSLEEVPPHDVGLVPGTSKYIATNTLNRFYTARIETAIKLYKTGKVKDFILSGDNAHRSYNEPWTMKRDFLKAGVADEDIYLDYAGFRTLDSVIRAREIFQADHFLIVTQNFHCERALFIANYHNIEADCLAVPDPESQGQFYVRAREVLARTKAVLDLYVLNAQPKFLGEILPIDSDSDADPEKLPQTEDSPETDNTADSENTTNNENISEANIDTENEPSSEALTEEDLSLTENEPESAPQAETSVQDEAITPQTDAIEEASSPVINEENSVSEESSVNEQNSVTEQNSVSEENSINEESLVPPKTSPAEPPTFISAEVEKAFMQNDQVIK